MKAGDRVNARARLGVIRCRPFGSSLVVVEWHDGSVGNVDERYVEVLDPL